MFLNQLSDVEKNAFLNLSIYVAKANGIFAEEEKSMIDDYCKEMGISSYDVNQSQSLSEIADVINKSELHIKKIIMLEILGLAYADGTYDDSENNFMKEFSEDIGMTSSQMDTLKEVICEYLEVLKKITEAVV